MATTVEDLYRQVLGREPDAEGLSFWKSAFGSSVDPAEQASFMQSVQNVLASAPVEKQATLAPNLTTTSSTPAVVAKLTDQILSQGTASQWSGEGFGSAEANAADMAKILAKTGITDISQFGQIQKTIPAQEQQVESGDGVGTVIVPEHTVTTFGNKVTGQEVPNTYSERQVGNFFGGTFAGKGNTGYGVQFDAQGNPIFYTQGASSKDTSLLPLLQIGLMATGAGGLLGNALLGAGASQIAAGALGGGLIGGATNALAGGNFLKGAALGAAGGALGGYLQGGGPIDASNMTSAQFNDALESQLINSLQGAGLTNQQINQWLENASAADIASVVNTVPVTGASTTPITTPTTADGLFNIPSADTVNITGSNVPTQLSPDIFSAITSQLSNNLTAITPNVEVTAQNPNKAVVPSILPINTNLTTTNVVPNVEVTGTADNNKITTPVVTLPSDTTTTTTTSGNNTTDLTDDQKINLAKAGLSLVNLLGGGAVVGGLLGGGGTGTVNVGALPTQGVPLNSDDYFNAIQRNYNALLPAVPRDVASPLRSWYTSQYGA